MNKETLWLDMLHAHLFRPPAPWPWVTWKWWLALNRGLPIWEND